MVRSSPLILYVSGDQIVPIGASALLEVKPIRSSTPKVYLGFSHGMCTVNQDQINADFLALIEVA